MTNGERIETARKIIEVYQDCTGTDDLETSASDLLADLFHLLHLDCGPDSMERVVDRAWMHFDEEVLGLEEG